MPIPVIEEAPLNVRVLGAVPFAKVKSKSMSRTVFAGQVSMNKVLATVGEVESNHMDAIESGGGLTLIQAGMKFVPLSVIRRLGAFCIPVHEKFISLEVFPKSPVLGTKYILIRLKRMDPNSG
jgi:hypothetical protein